MQEYLDWISSINAEQIQRIANREPRPITHHDAAESLLSASTENAIREAALTCFALLIQSTTETRRSKVEKTECAVEPLLAAIVSLLPLNPSHSGINVTKFDAATKPNNSHALNAELGLAALYLISQTTIYNIEDEVAILVVSYTDPLDPWTTEKSAHLACKLLAVHLPSEKKLRGFITGTILYNYLRPLFSKSYTKAAIPGAVYPHQDPRHLRSSSSSSLPWKIEGNHVLSIFHWAVNFASSGLIADNWPLLVPVLVTLADDGDTAIRKRGLEIVVLFLRKCPAQTIQSTGIATVFQQTVFPTLLFLPTLTPEHDSISLLRLSYRALFLLAETESIDKFHQRQTLLDRLLRDGILAGYSHATEYAGVVQVLMDTTVEVTTSLQLCCAKHLGDLLHMFSSVMTDPFALLHPQSTVAAIKALNVVLTFSWSSIWDGHYTAIIVNMISICWLQMKHTSATSQASSRRHLGLVSDQLLITSAILKSMWKTGAQKPPQRLVDAIDLEPHLAELFQDCLTDPYIGAS